MRQRIKKSHVKLLCIKRQMFYAATTELLQIVFIIYKPNDYPLCITDFAVATHFYYVIGAHEWRRCERINFGLRK